MSNRTLEIRVQLAEADFNGMEEIEAKNYIENVLARVKKQIFHSVGLDDGLFPVFRDLDEI